MISQNTECAFFVSRKFLRRGVIYVFRINGNKAEKIEEVTFSSLDMRENDIEEIIRCNIDMICDEEESLLIVGQQVKNEKKGRSDLTAVDNNGSIVLIEIKRDPRDIEKRAESFEFQAIRYAASYATITDTEELVNKVYAPYIEKNRDEFDLGILTPFELGIRKLNEFLKENEALNSFNKGQRIILLSSDFDDQTLSAVAWLNKNNVDISCYKLIPYKINNEIFINKEKVLPVKLYDDYYLNLMDRSLITSVKTKKEITRRSLPKIDAMLEWGVVKEGDTIVAKGKKNEAILQKNGNVKVNGEEKTLQTWLKHVFGWSSVQTYEFSVHKESGKTLSQIRQEYLDKMTEEEAKKENNYY